MPIRLVVTLAVVLIVAAISPVTAQSQRTDQLMWDCEGRGEISDLGILSCVSYLSGMNDFNAVLQGINGTGIFCTPKTGVSNDQLRLIFIKWAKEHPEDLHTSARMSAIFALSDAFPCVE